MRDALRQELAVALVLIEGLTLEPDVAQETLGGASDKDFYRLAIFSAVIAFPTVPALFLEGVDVVVLEFDADEEARWVM
ncbi:hypothetical protein D7X12_13250 [Corallococcus sicarius]|uniref:Uncharacterized protein n=1 Tax=Corallococcus sicarius TaxID=2316726 RepID=A0A3A8NGL4_9BACT|nr:hypothetical protein D7X12_13250 [Corallococcus sicarius]